MTRHDNERIVGECAVCGVRETITMPIPRFGAVPKPAGGKHPERVRFDREHAHPDRGHPMSWARPLRNLAAHQGGINLGLLAARHEADLNERDGSR